MKLYETALKRTRKRKRKNRYRTESKEPQLLTFSVNSFWSRKISNKKLSLVNVIFGNCQVRIEPRYLERKKLATLVSLRRSYFSIYKYVHSRSIYAYDILYFGKGILDALRFDDTWGGGGDRKTNKMNCKNIFIRWRTH